MAKTNVEVVTSVLTDHQAYGLNDGDYEANCTCGAKGLSTYDWASHLAQTLDDAGLI